MPRLDACAYCGSVELERYLSLGEQPPSNSFVSPADVSREARYPLDVAVCRSCWLSQLTFVVPPERTFDRYVYVSSASAALSEHYRLLVGELLSRARPREDALVVDVGCNDGVLLEAYPRTFRRVGVEPSDVAEVARSRGLEVVRAFFDERIAAEILERHGPAAIVTATNVFAHVDRPDEFTRGIRRLLGSEGIFVIEASYLPSVLEGPFYDTIYHEHLRYLSLTALLPFLREHELVVADAERVPFGASGPAFRVTAVRSERAVPRASVQEMLDRERVNGIRDASTYASFAERVVSHRARLRLAVEDLTRRAGPVPGYGAPAKGNTLLNYLGLDASTIPYLADANRLKQGLLAPGSHVPVVGEERLLGDMPSHALLLAWNYLEYFLANSEYVRRGGRFLVPLPQIAVAPAA